MLKEFVRPDDGLDKAARKAEANRLQEKLTAHQILLKDARLPVIVLVEGWAAAGKGSLINDFISDLDPRFCSVFSADSAARDADRYPFLYPYFNAIPEEGKLLFMDSGWMEATVRAAISGELSKKDYRRRILSVNRFERQLRDNGYLLLKLFVNIPRDEQAERLEALCADDDTSWRVTAYDLWQNEDYGDFRKAYDAFMTETQEITPWHILDGSKKNLLKYDAFRLLTELIDAGIAAGKVHGAPFDEVFPLLPMPQLADVDLNVSISRDDYNKELKALQKKISRLHNVVYRKRIPFVICYEGWDAAGKGGNIRRLAYPLDPRGFDVYPIASPLPHEKARHHLWRFWTRLPRTGHFAIFDRTWYGRVMVERLEGFCTQEDWQRAFNEINEFEEELHDWGAVILKFWIHIDPETQLARFTMRQNTPEKQWKITEEDWRNREKWPQYEEAVNEMLQKTSTEYAPWYIIESNDKLYARIKVLRIVAEAMEKAVGKEKDKD